MSVGLILLALAGELDDEAEFSDAIHQYHSIAPATNLKIVEDSWKAVRGKVQRGEAELAIPANDVTDTDYGDAWPRFTEAKKSVRQGRYTTAIELFDRFLKKAKDKPWSLQYSLYYGGFARLQRADRGKGDLAETRKLFKRLIREVPESRFLYEAYVGVADSYFYGQNWDEAEKAYNLASKELDGASQKTMDRPALSRYYGRKKWLAETKIAESYEARENWTLAKMRYREVAASAYRYGDVAAIAKSGEGRCLVAERAYDHAITFFKDMIEKAEQARQFDVLGGAYCGRGDAYLGKKEYLPAMWDYKRVTVMYSAEPQYAAKAHFRAGRCYEFLAEREKNSLKFARRHYNKVVELFPDSPWKDEAEARLQVIGGEAPAE